MQLHTDETEKSSSINVYEEKCEKKYRFEFY